MTGDSQNGVAVPLNVTVSVFAVLGWIAKLDALIAGELDAGRSATAKELGQIRAELSERANLDKLLERSPVDRLADPEGKCS